MLAERAPAQCPTATNSGADFLFTFPSSAGPVAGGQLAILSDDPPSAAAVVEVTIPNCGTTDHNVSSTSPALITVCAAAEFLGAGPAAGYHIRVRRVNGTTPSLQVIFKNSSTADSSDDAFLVLPQAVLGNAYWVLGYLGVVSLNIGARWAAVARDAGPTVVDYRDCNNAAAPTPAMAQNDVFQQVCIAPAPRDDGTGYRISSANAFALITGSEGSNVPVLRGTAEALLEMMPPEGWAGTSYIVTEFNKSGNYGAFAGDLVRIMAVDANATVTVTTGVGGVASPDPSSNDLGMPRACAVPSGFMLVNPGDWCDLSITGGAWIRTAPGGPRILVGHFMKGYNDTGTGDPSFVLATPIDRMRCGQRFFSFPGFPYDPVDLDGTYVNVVATSSAIGSLALDGVPLGDVFPTCVGFNPILIPGSGYSWTKCGLPDPPAGGQQHTLDGGTSTFAAYAYGQRLQIPSPAFAGAYAYPTGFGF